MRSKLQKKVLQGAQQTLNKFNKELESSEHAIAIKETNF
jgi:leucine-zipper-like transcriptional regulator 1